MYTHERLVDDPRHFRILPIPPSIRTDKGFHELHGRGWNTSDYRAAWDSFDFFAIGQEYIVVDILKWRLSRICSASTGTLTAAFSLSDFDFLVGDLVTICEMTPGKDFPLRGSNQTCSCSLHSIRSTYFTQRSASLSSSILE